jgi:cytochrome P450
MSATASNGLIPPGPRPTLAAPVRPPTMLPPLQFVRRLQQNFISVWPDAAYVAPVTAFRVGTRSMFTANSPALIKHVMLDNARNYHKTPVARRLFAPALGQGLLTSEDEVWRQNRQLMAPMFAPKRMAALAGDMVAETERYFAQWHALAGAEFDLVEAMVAITLQIITRTMFGAESQEDAATVAADMHHYQEILRPSVLDFIGAPNWVPRPGTRPAQRIGDRLTETIERMIARRRSNGSTKEDLLGLLMAAVDTGDMTTREIRDEIATIFTAGHETTAMTLSWIFYLLDRHPDVAARLVAEVDTVLGSRAATAEDIERLTYTRMVIDESMRLYPPAHSTTRLALGSDQLGDVAIPKHSVVVISPWLTHRNPTLWPDPGRFDPERFDPARSERRDRYAFLPFGAGPRICIGAGFALTEAVLVLATIVRHWKIRLVADQTIEPVALITLRPRYGLRATVAPRAA